MHAARSPLELSPSIWRQAKQAAHDDTSVAFLVRRLDPPGHYWIFQATSLFWKTSPGQSTMADSKLLKLNPLVAGKIAKQVMEDMKLAASARRIAPHLVGASYLNRDGLLTNGHVVHGDILVSINKDGHDPSLTKPAPCIHYTDLAKLEKLLEHNRRIKANAPGLMPDVSHDMCFGSLASTHYNTGLRCGHQGMLSPVVGDLRAIMDKDSTFKDAVQHGHTWLVLPDTIPDEAARRISKWFNQEQNRNKTLDEVEMIRMCLDILDEFLAKTHGKQNLQLSKLTLALGQRIPLEMPRQY